MKPGEVGFFLETAHPAKFKSTVESIIGKEVEIPAVLQAFMKGTKQTVECSKNFEDFKAKAAKFAPAEYEKMHRQWPGKYPAPKWLTKGEQREKPQQAPENSPN